MTQDREQPGHGQPPVLPYRPAAEDRREGTHQTVIAALLTFALVASTVALALIVSSNAVSAWWLAAILIEIFALMALAVWLRTRPGRRRWAAGVWIGLGLACLIEGACYAMIW